MQSKTPLDAIKRLRERLPQGGRIYAPGCSGEPRIFVDALSNDRSLAANLTFLGVWIPGVNNVDYAGLHAEARSETIFMAAPLRESFERGAIDIRPLSYSQAYPWLETTPLDAALFQVTSPDANGEVSLGVSADFSPAIWARRNVIKVAHVNPQMPRPAHAPTVSINAFDIVCEQTEPVLEYAPLPLAKVFDDIAENISTLIGDGDVLQFGLGNVQLSVLRALSGKRNLSVHSGMISDPILDAADVGALKADKGAITTGVALGTKKLYDFCRRDQRLVFAPVSETHSIDTLRAIENFVAVNSVIEIDLFGQANAEYLGQRQISGAGGIVDFLRGAAESKNGRPVIALASTAKGGAVSRIVPKLKAPSISVGRSDAGIVVTEHGLVDIRGMTIDERASALIEVADPEHRKSLRKAWFSMKEEL